MDRRTEWWYEWPEYGGQVNLELRIDEDSTKEEIESEIEYWSDQLSYDPPDLHRREIIRAIGWMNTLIGG